MRLTQRLGFLMMASAANVSADCHGFLERGQCIFCVQGCSLFAAGPGTACEDCCISGPNSTKPTAQCVTCKFQCECANLCSNESCQKFVTSKPVELENKDTKTIGCGWLAKDSCCDLETMIHIERSVSPIYDKIFDICPNCARNWERVACAASCHPHQINFVELKARNEYGVLSDTSVGFVNLCSSLCDSLYYSCQDDDMWGPDFLFVRDVYQDAKAFCESGAFYFGNGYGRFDVRVVDDDMNQGKCLSASTIKAVNPAEDLFLATHYCGAQDNSLYATVNTLLVALATLGLGSIGSELVERMHWRYLPESGVMIALGVILALIVEEFSGSHAVHLLSFRNDIFQVILLPPIMFQSGYCLRPDPFMKNFDAIIVHAIFGTIIATSVVLLIMMGLGTVFLPSITAAEWAAFASLIAAIDPVATLATFHELRVSRQLHSVVFGEALINDVVAILLFSTCIQWVDLSKDNNPTISSAALLFFKLLLGSFGLGLMFGILLSFISKPGFLSTSLEVTVFVAVSWCSYLLAEAFHMSGILCALTCGLFCEHYAFRNLSQQAKASTVIIYTQLAAMADGAIFVYVGMLAVLEFSFVNPVAIFSTMFAILVARACSVFPLSGCINWRRRRRKRRQVSGADGVANAVADFIPFKHQVVMFVGGLRGAIAIALALRLPSHFLHFFLSTTVYVAILTVFIFGGATPKLLKCLDVRVNVPQPLKVENKYTSDDIERMKGWRYFDNKYIKPVFIRRSCFLIDPSKQQPFLDQESKEEGILDHLNLSADIFQCSQLGSINEARKRTCETLTSFQSTSRLPPSMSASDIADMAAGTYSQSHQFPA